MLFILCSGECQAPDLKSGENEISEEPDFPGLLTGTNSSPIRNVRYFGPALYMLIVDLAENLRRRKLLQRTLPTKLYLTEFRPLNGQSKNSASLAPATA